jgi:very-short-patch-repair endonuclease/intein/homing endonuclease
MADNIQTSNLENTFQALKNQNVSEIIQRSVPDYKSVPNQNYPSNIGPVSAFNGGMYKFGGAAPSGGMIYGQPQFFSPVHTPINWQIPSKRIEQYQWSRFFYCLTPDNQILMDNGTEKKICEIVEGDRIIDENGNMQKVLKVHTRNIDEDIYDLTIGGSNTKISITGSHEIKILRKEDWEKSSETVWSERRKKERLKRFGETNLGESWEEVKDVNVGDCMISPSLKPGDGFMPDIFTSDMCWLLGLFVADGSYYWYNYKKERKYPKGIRITLSNDERNTVGEKVKRIIKNELQLKTKEYKNGIGKCYDIVLNNVPIPKLFYAVVGEGCLTKKICPEFMNNASEDQLLNFIAGFSDGDGCLSNNYGDQMRTSSPYLALQLGIICTKINLTYSSSWAELDPRRFFDKDRNIYSSYISNSWNIRIGRMSCDRLKNICEKYIKLTKRHHNKIREYITLNNKTYRKIIKIERRNYRGVVYDLEIENNHTYCVNGCVVHNSNEAKVASSIDFYSFFPVNDFTNECKDVKVKKYFDKLKRKLDITKWLRLMSHEIHLLGDCFPFIEVSCEECGGEGRIGDEICNHPGGSARRLVILNPDFVEVYSNPLNPEAIIALKPDEELINMVHRRTPGLERLSPRVISLISAGKPIRLDNRNVSHLKYGECGYSKYGIGMVRRLFPILSYKTKLMVAQWIVAERLIIPIKVVKVGSDERPAGPADIAAVQEQLAQTANDPNLTIVTHHAFDIEWIGSSGRVLTLSNEFELINQEILDGMMINNALLNGEGPNFSSAAVGIEAMIERLETFRSELGNWVEQKIYLPEAQRQGFIAKDKDSEEDEYIYPKVKWNPMHLRDQQQNRQFVLQLYEKGLLSAQTVLEAFDFDPDQEIERKRFDAIQMASGQGMGMQPQSGAMGGGFGGGMGGGGMPGLEGLGSPGGAPPPGGEAPMGGEGAPISAPPAGGTPPASNSLTSLSSDTPLKASSTPSLSTEIANPSDFGGRILTKKTREQMLHEKEKIYKQRQSVFDSVSGKTRDSKGRIVFTKPERQLLSQLIQYVNNGIIKYQVVPQYAVKYGNIEYPIDFAIPNLRIGIEADGEAFHSNEKQVTHDKERDMKLSQSGWTILRFKDSEIEEQVERVMSSIVKTIMQKEQSIETSKEQIKNT